MDVAAGPQGRRVPAVLAGLVALALAGCAPTSGGVATAGGSASPTPAPTREPPHGSASIGKGTLSYADGVAVSVTSAATYDPSSTAVGHASTNTGVVVTVKVHNGGSGSLKGQDVVVGLEAAGKFTDQIFDPAQDIDAGMTGTIAAGTSMTGTYAFDVPTASLSSVTVNVNPDIPRLGVARFRGSVAG